MGRGLGEHLAAQQVDFTAPSQSSCRTREVTQPALTEVNILFPLLDKRDSGPISKEHSHFSRLSSSWGSRKASGLLHLALVTLSVYRFVVRSRRVNLWPSP